jgi:hypothetical protein
MLLPFCYRTLWPATKHLFSESAGRIPVYCVHEVAVGVHSDVNATVPHLALNVLGVLSLLDKQIQRAVRV